MLTTPVYVYFEVEHIDTLNGSTDKYLYFNHSQQLCDIVRVYISVACKVFNKLTHNITYLYISLYQLTEATSIHRL